MSDVELPVCIESAHGVPKKSFFADGIQTKYQRDWSVIWRAQLRLSKKIMQCRGPILGDVYESCFFT